MSSTRKTPEHLRPACNSRGEAVEAVEDAEAAEAVEAAVAAAAAAVCRRELAAGARLAFSDTLKRYRPSKGHSLLVTASLNRAARTMTTDYPIDLAGPEARPRVA
jgi:hypothetical protein